MNGAHDERRAQVQVGPNEVLRFLLELAALAAMALWGWTTNDGVMRWIAAIGVPLVAAAGWGVFRVPGDPGPAPVAVPGVVRLALEIVFFATAAVLLYVAGQPLPAVAFSALVLLHYAVGYRRITWLVAQR